MKNKLYYFGIACCMLIMLSGIFKIQHWPGAGIMFTLSMLLLALVFLPLAMTNSFKAEENKRIRILYITAYISFGFDLIAALFKLMGWPGGNLLMTIGIPLPFILFLPAYMRYVREDKNVNYNHLITVLFFFAYYGAITAFLALDISKNMINELVINANQTNETNRKITEQNLLLTEIAINKNDSDISKKEIIRKISKNTEKLCFYMDSLKKLIICTGNDENIRLPDLNQIDYWSLSCKNGKGAGSKVMIYRENGEKLKQKIDEYRIFLVSESKIKSSGAVNFINEILTSNGEGIFAWNEEIFFNKHMIAAIGYIDALKKRVLMSQLEALTAI